MNILITGASGLVGSDFADRAKNTADWQVLTPSSKELDITDPQRLASFFQRENPDAVLHFAAFTDVADGERQRGDTKGSCWAVNVEGTRNLVRQAREGGIYTIFISTDYVFSGSKVDPGPYREDHTPAQNVQEVSWYGWTKSQAEKILLQENPESAIVRIANPVRGSHEKKADLSKKILQKFDSGAKISLFNDQYFTVTAVSDVTKVCQRLIEEKKSGIFHVSSPDITTPFEFGEYLLQRCRNASDVIFASSLETFQTLPNMRYRYPQYGGLDVRSTTEDLGVHFNTWREIIDKIVSA